PARFVGQEAGPPPCTATLGSEANNGGAQTTLPAQDPRVGVVIAGRQGKVGGKVRIILPGHRVGVRPPGQAMMRCTF
ncbi:MAG: hypothetical protein ACRDQX_02230, partial [Pseudonocardiaceae bacterium]